MKAARPREVTGWQAQKSAATRDLIVDATIRCLGEIGYRRTTTHAIAAEAGLSRGALLHHFPAKADAIHASIEAVYGQRVQALARGLGRRLPAGSEGTGALLQALWPQLRDRSFAVVLELGVAARTDRRLAGLLAPAEAAYRREWRRLTRAALVAAAESGATTDSSADTTDAVLDATRAALEGLAFAAAFSAEAPPAIQTVLHGLERVLGRSQRTPVAG